ncbi:HAMP domain-containing histidine kinase [Sphaerospermopsis sp. FACHB-1094]|uniref:histidine kinase n=1 Tax=Sphaerospermopsis reniformis TaxID=531300 RepID=A0A480A4S2_9CYAN|nr:MULTISPECIES: HAMP domain-containing sensor histidine kinase [Sphaerospermopsis]MBD2134559.1 HAMP domain-containing histidine kinase [Sphaerospermopsis sp. FACHB-1094]GCL38428.1 histidine kinase [Sphaerospermopsis reniformis]
MIRGIICTKPEISCHDLRSSHIQEFCQLQSEQLTNQYPILLARIVYYDCWSKKHQEIINYSDISEKTAKLLSFILTYLRSEAWLIDYPAVGEIHEFKIEELHLFSYVFPIGYRNQKPEYIQIITENTLVENAKNEIKKSAILLSKYADLYLDYGRQKSEIKLLEQVLHRVGHQLRNYLGLIGLYANNLCFSLKDQPEYEQAKIIRESIEDIDINLTEIINCGQGEKLRVTPQDLRNLVLETIKYLQPLINEKQVKISIPETSTTLLIDKLQIKQVFHNILNNAIYFSPESGTITCSWKIFQEEVLIKISDQGKGLSSEDIQKIFTPFYTRRPGGIGLGLTIAKKIILDHHGNLWAQSLSEGGAQFCIILPCTKNI